VKTRAAVFRGVGRPIEIEEIELDAPGPGEVQVRTAAAGICHSDLHFVEGLYPCPVPTVLGHEAAGVVEAVGPGVGYVAPGDPVVACVSIFCGRCEACLRGRPQLCSKEGVTRAAGAPPRLRQRGAPLHQFMELSCYAERILVHENALVRIARGIPLEKAALLGCGVVTGVGAVLHTARVEPGSTVVVVGCGGIGLNAVQGARLVGARRIVAVDRVASKLALARELGATDTVDASRGDPVLAVLGLLGGGADHSFEAVGRKDTAEQCFAMLKPGGTCTVIGMIPMGTKLELDGFQLLLEKKLQGTNMGSNRFRLDMPAYLELWAQGRLELDRLLSRRLRLEELAVGFELLRGGEVARSVIVFD
jgi:S-(hydroxymethyl)glutathione dehydrogenase/alcohol dehydrogenase